ncbi:MAG: cobalamin B12-binding domain-containing protein [Bacillota bacterium]|jgi:dimethylamine corrinoid protein
MECVEKLVQAVMEGDDDVAAEVAQEVVEKVEDLQPVVAKLTEAMRELGKKFETFEIFLPEMMCSSDAMTAAMDVFGPKLGASGAGKKKGVVVIGGAPGDMHEIGKNIVSTVLRSDGYEVADLGRDVAVLDFVKKAQELNADIIAVSALMTTTMPGAKEVIRILVEQGLREKYKVIVGGAPTNGKWAQEIGADGWAENSTDAVTLCNNLMGVE